MPSAPTRTCMWQALCGQSQSSLGSRWEYTMLEVVSEHGQFLARETVLWLFCLVLCVYLVNLHLLDYNEVYSVTIPNAYGRYCVCCIVNIILKLFSECLCFSPTSRKKETNMFKIMLAHLLSLSLSFFPFFSLSLLPPPSPPPFSLSLFLPPSLPQALIQSFTHIYINTHMHTGLFWPFPGLSLVVSVSWVALRLAMELSLTSTVSRSMVARSTESRQRCCEFSFSAINIW